MEKEKKVVNAEGKAEGKDQAVKSEGKAKGESKMKIKLHRELFTPKEGNKKKMLWYFVDLSHFFPGQEMLVGMKPQSRDGYALLASYIFDRGAKECNFRVVRSTYTNKQTRKVETRISYEAYAKRIRPSDGEEVEFACTLRPTGSGMDILRGALEWGPDLFEFAGRTEDVVDEDDGDEELNGAFVDEDGFNGFSA